MMRTLSALVAGALLCSLAGCPSPPPPANGVDAGVPVEVQTLAASPQFPVAMALSPDGRLFYTEKDTGRIRIISPEGQLLAEPFADVAVVSNGERGLLGIALHPQFEQNGFVYVFYTRSSTGADTRTHAAAFDNRVVRFVAAGNVAAGPEQLIFAMPATPGPNHNGGNIHFGPDGKLYITLGDLGDPDHAQTTETLPGKILRINDDGSIPADNPFIGGAAVFALGLRNSFDFTFDPISGAIFATENGTNRHDEINRIVAGGNYGWPNVEGRAGDSAFVPDEGFLVDPLVDYTLGSAVPTGIAFAPDDTFGAESEHQMFVAEYSTGRIMRYTLNQTRDAVVAQAVFIDGIAGGMTDLLFTPDGTLYVSTSTSILHIVPEQPEP